MVFLAELYPHKTVTLSLLESEFKMGWRGQLQRSKDVIGHFVRNILNITKWEIRQEIDAWRSAEDAGALARRLHKSPTNIRAKRQEIAFIMKYYGVDKE